MPAVQTRSIPNVPCRVGRRQDAVGRHCEAPRKGYAGRRFAIVKLRACLERAIVRISAVRVDTVWVLMGQDRL